MEAIEIARMVVEVYDKSTHSPLLGPDRQEDPPHVMIARAYVKLYDETMESIKAELPSVEAIERLRVSNSEAAAARYPDEEELF